MRLYCEDALYSHFRENNKKNCTMSPKTTLANLEKKRKGKNERERRKEGEKVKERKLALVALLVLYSCGFR